ncbi:hypothetical protein SD70_05440 [Gordoniibacillus kamchatkensis]|uniref:Uncharacterized protein n=1 Tax=Gordoniibacillus kamchatkensis TaxID=1590651 RepID=A0ABR5AL93_9BACL|nr:CBO0543 family protein [Paenibacillus sp. VKM B-2647]KIL41788.1 hypothetical protein SD70_05440 [Paenibacillus sp. VKM B-2647]
MAPDQIQHLKQLKNLESDAASSWASYWMHYSHMGTWQFWFIVLLLVGPLVAVFLWMDRRKALLLGFYGFSVHVCYTYIDLFGSKNGWWEYPYKALPFVPINLALDTSFVPVAYMLMYQWSLNRGYNYYVVQTGVSIVFAGVIKPFLTALHLFEMYGWMNYFYLFVGYMVVTLLSKWITDLFIWFQKNERARAA